MIKSFRSMFNTIIISNPITIVYNSVKIIFYWNVIRDLLT